MTTISVRVGDGVDKGEGALNETRMVLADRVREVVQNAAAQRLTGSVTLHFSDGQLKLVEEKRAWKPEPRLTSP